MIIVAKDIDISFEESTNSTNLKKSAGDIDFNKINLIFLISNLLLFIIIYVILIFIEPSTTFINYEIESSNIVYVILVLGFSFLLCKIKRMESERTRFSFTFSFFFIFIILGIINLILITNIISLFSWFVTSILLLGFLFYTNDKLMDFGNIRNLFKLVYISLGIFTFSLILSIVSINFTLLSSLTTSFLEYYDNNIALGLILLSFTIIFSLFPYTIKFFKTYFQDNSYTGLFLSASFFFIISFLIFRLRLLIIPDFFITFLSFYILPIISICFGVLYLCLELFSIQEGLTYSVKKTFGYYLIIDFNMILLLLSLFTFIPAIEYEIYVSSITFFSMITFIFKVLIILFLVPLIYETDEDNIHLIGNLNEKYKFYGILFFLFGLLLILFIGCPILYSLISLVNIESFYSNSILNLSLIIVISMFTLYILVFLASISTLYLNLYHHKKEYYRKSSNNLNLNWIYSIISYIIMIGLCIILIVYSLNKSVFLNLFLAK